MSEAVETIAAARALIAARVAPVAGFETCALPDSLGRVVASDVPARLTLPPFDNSAMDGWAYRHQDGAVQLRLRIEGESAAGLPLDRILAPGTTARISTGAMLPRGADTVAMQEEAQRDGDWITVDTPPARGSAVRKAGEDIQQGAVAIEAGRRLRPQDLALLLSLGERDIEVRRRVRVAIIGTGSELRTLDDGAGPPRPGQIFDSNRPMLRALLASWPVEIETLPILADDRAATERALTDAAQRFDLVISTGGVSVGDHDHVRPALETHGEILFWRLAIRPGRPVLLGRIGHAVLLGLPGNPVSVAATWALLGRAVLAACAGAHAPRDVRIPVTLASSHSKPARLNEFVRARIEDGRATLYRAQGSNLLTSLTWSDGLCDLPAGRDRFAPGDVVDFLPYSGIFD